MAEYYSIQEVASKLRKTEEDVQELVKQGKLHQYMDSGQTVFKTEDVDALADEIVGLDISSFGLDSEDGSGTNLELEETSEITLEPDDNEDSKNDVSEKAASSPGPDDMDLDLEPDLPKQKEQESEGGFGLSQMGDLTMADTNVGTVGINILSGTGDSYQLTEDTKAETTAEDIDELESLDADSNLESFGSGSGLLDLSLQADDTSLGAVLDDILPTGAEEAGGGGADIPVDEMGLAEETENLLGEEPQEHVPAEAGAPMGAVPAVMPMPVSAAAAVEPGTSVFGVMMFLPLLALIAASIVLTAAVQNVMPALIKPLVTTEMAGISLIWIIVGGLTVLLLLILLFAALAGGGGGTKAQKTKSQKTKTKKEKKPKKAKAPKKKRK